MKKINEKQISPASNFRFRKLVLAMLCILFLLSPAAIILAGPDNGSSSADVIQQDAVRGTVKDAATGEALIGVTVMVKGTTLGTITDINGQFNLRLPTRDALLSVSFIGYTTQEIQAQQGANINIAMELAVTQMQEVVVVGYGVQ